MHNYDHKEIEKKWQDKWQKSGLYTTKDKVEGKENFYSLVEFPYPSGNLHVGHWYAFSVTDIYARLKRAQGLNVMFPIGFDAFGLPAENAAIKRGLNPRDWTYDNMESMKKQLHSMGAMFDWGREVVTCDPGYYKWTQWIFSQFFKNDLAYQAETPVSWCPSCKTVLANEQVVQGECERCGTAVEKKEMNQWMLRTTKYADRLLDGLENLDWKDEIKTSQINWIDRKSGINLHYKVDEVDETLTCFTTRPDTNFGATFIVLAPEHKFISKYQNEFPNSKEVKKYVTETETKKDLDRIADGKSKTGVFTGWYVTNTLNNKKLPIYIGDFVLATVGTGAVVGVPGHDARDFEFAQIMDIEVVRVVVSSSGDTSPITSINQVQEKEGKMINSDFLDGMEIMKAKEKMMDYIEEKGWGERVRSYRLRDWLISRQRYWGCPIPIIHCADCGAVSVPEEDLPVLLPEIDDYLPRDDGKSPLAKAADWLKVKCPKCDKDAERETDTFDTFMDSSWYYLRYADSENKDKFADDNKIKNWLPVDFYSGGAEHTTMHLLYSRFFAKALFDLKIIPFEEPFTKRINRGLILGPDGNKMSKSKGNVIDPDEIVERLGSDTVRLYLGFIGPYNETGSYPWDPNGVVGIRRFLERIWKLSLNISSEKNEGVEKELHKTVQKVGEDSSKLKFNTAISALMIFSNLSEKEGVDKEQFETFLKLLAPFAPHITEEIWHNLGNGESIHIEAWPEFDTSKIIEGTGTLGIQIDGKIRGNIKVPVEIIEDDLKKLIVEDPRFSKWLEGHEINKFIYIKGRLVSIVLRSNS